MRKLASIQTVNAVERVRVLGWWVVVGKGDYKVGDSIVYVEIDALLPERPEFEFLRARCYKPPQVDTATGQVTCPAGFRIKTARLRGQVSQGICFPTSILAGCAVPFDDIGEVTEGGADVTDLLGIVKWEPPPPTGMDGVAKGQFPGFLRKTDEARIQVLEPILERHRGKRFCMTEKLDGTSFTAFFRDGVFGICGRNLQLEEDGDHAMARLAKSLGLEEKLRSCAAGGLDLAFQGEVIGPGVQKNKYNLKTLELRVFNVVTLSDLRLMSHEASLALLGNLGLTPVPQLGTLVLDHTVDELVALAEGKSVLNPKVEREGIVFRPPEDERDETIGGRLSFKAINPKFLLKFDE